MMPAVRALPVGALLLLSAGCGTLGSIDGRWQDRGAPPFGPCSGVRHDLWMYDFAVQAGGC
jgi:hypothetical protein